MVVVRVFYGPDVFGGFPIGGDVSFIQCVLSESERWSLRNLRWVLWANLQLISDLIKSVIKW